MQDGARRAPDDPPGDPGNAAVTGPERSQGYAGNVKFGIPEWGSPLPGMAPAPLPTLARLPHLHLVLTVHDSCHI